MKKLFLPLLAAATFLILVGGVFLASKSSSPAPAITPPATYVYYWGDGCPHCTKVEEFLSSWDKKDKVQIEKKEVWKNVKNADEMTKVADFCKIPEEVLGVPLLFTPEGTCLTGDQPIIDYLKNLEQ